MIVIGHFSTLRGAGYKLYIRTVCKGKSRINSPQEPTRLGDDAN